MLKTFGILYLVGVIIIIFGISMNWLATDIIEAYESGEQKKKQEKRKGRKKRAQKRKEGTLQECLVCHQVKYGVKTSVGHICHDCIKSNSV